MQLLLARLRTVSHSVLCMGYTCLCYVEDKVPTVKELNRYVIRQYSTNWEDIGIKLGMDHDLLQVIEANNPGDSRMRCLATLNEWLKVNPDDATWKKLELALTNVNREKLGLDPVDDVYGKDV